MMKNKKQMSPEGGLHPILDSKISTGARLLWTIIQYRKQVNPDDYFSMEELASTLNASTDVLISYLGELGQRKYLPFLHIDFTDGLFQTEVNEGLSTMEHSAPS